MNDLDEDISSNILKFADDTKIFREVRNSTDCSQFQAHHDRLFFGTEMEVKLRLFFVYLPVVNIMLFSKLVNLFHRQLLVAAVKQAAVIASTSISNNILELPYLLQVEKH